MMLTRSLTAERVPHAYMFKGPDGVGKRLFAKGVAAALNCRDHSDVWACGLCVSCRKFRSMNHPDFLVVSPEKGVIKIDQIRNLSKELTYPPYESSKRVVVLEDVHTMRREAGNSLLKTLEEPPENNVLILTAESSQEILSTLNSRCQVVPFTQLSVEDTVVLLVRRGVDAEEAKLLARLAEGSPGQALLYEKKGMVALGKQIIDTVSDKRIDPDRDVGIVLQLAEKMTELKDNLPSLLGLLRLWLRDVLLQESNELRMSVSTGDELKSWSSRQVFAKLRAIDRAENELVRNCNRSLVCENLLFTLQ